MALEDAISRARQEQDSKDRQERQEQEWKREGQQLAHRLAVEAARRLRPYVGRESLHMMRRVRGPQNSVRRERVAAFWCWRIKDLSVDSIGRREKVLLLVLNKDGTDAAFAVVTLDWPSFKDDAYVTMLDLEQVGPHDYADKGMLVFIGTEWVKHLEQDVADAIVRYERAAG